MCQTASAAEVVFIVDESVSSRHPEYSRMVRDILKLTVHTFRSSSQLENDSLNFRFAVLKYSNDPSIAFNLGQYADSMPMLNHLEQLNYEGRLSNLGKALDLTKREVSPSSCSHRHGMLPCTVNTLPPRIAVGCSSL